VKEDKKFFHGHDRLAEERAKLWPTQQLAADFFGVSRVTWGQCERGNATPSGDVLAGLAQHGADVLYILTGQRTGGATASAPALARDEEILLDNYRHCPPDARAAIKATSDALARCSCKQGKAA
jgi:DNA-binding XRE family transcriptional regulator